MGKMQNSFFVPYINSYWISNIGGDGRTRTAVQTPHQAAFYTLILSLVVGLHLPEDRPMQAYPLNLGRV